MSIRRPRSRYIPVFGHVDIISRAPHVRPDLTPGSGVDIRACVQGAAEGRGRHLRRAAGRSYVERKQAQVIVRGLRAVSDFEFEFQMALMNQRSKCTLKRVDDAVEHRRSAPSSGNVSLAAWGPAPGLLKGVSGRKSFAKKSYDGSHLAHCRIGHDEGRSDGLIFSGAPSTRIDFGAPASRISGRPMRSRSRRTRRSTRISRATRGCWHNAFKEGDLRTTPTTASTTKRTRSSLPRGGKQAPCCRAPACRPR